MDLLTGDDPNDTSSGGAERKGDSSGTSTSVSSSPSISSPVRAPPPPPGVLSQRQHRPPPPPPPPPTLSVLSIGTVENNRDAVYAPVDGLTEAQVDAYFSEADTNGTGRVIQGEALAFFLRTGIPVEVLAMIWARVRPPDVVGGAEEGLSRHQFSLVLRLVAYVQSGYDITDEVMVVQALDPLVWEEAGMRALPAPELAVQSGPGAAGVGQGHGAATGDGQQGGQLGGDGRGGRDQQRDAQQQQQLQTHVARKSASYTDAKHPPLAFEVRYPPLHEKESAKLAGLVGVDGLLMAYPSFHNGVLVWGHAEGNPADVQLASEDDEGLNAKPRSLLRFASQGLQHRLPAACPREDRDAAHCVEVKNLTHKERKISCCYMEQKRGILWVADKEGYVSAYSTAHINAMATARDHLLHRWRACRVGHVTCMTTSMNHELWTGNNRGIIRVWPHTAGEATMSSVFNPFAEDCEHKGRELRKGTFDRAHSSKILALLCASNGHTVWSVSKQAMLIWDVGSGVCFGGVGEGSGKESAGKDPSHAGSPTEYGGTGIISKHVGLDVDPLSGSILWRPAREDYDYCHSQQETWAALSERGVVELTERITEGAERAVSFLGKLAGSGSKKSSQSRANTRDTLVSHESSKRNLLGEATSSGLEKLGLAGLPIGSQIVTPGKIGKHSVVTALAPFDDTIWIGRSDGIISVFEGAGKLVENISLGATERTHSTAIRCMALVGREVWVGTSGGDIHRISVEDRLLQGTFRAHSSAVLSIVQTGVRAYALGSDGSISGFNTDQSVDVNQLCWKRFEAEGSDCYSRTSLGVLAVTWNCGESRPDVGSSFFRWIAENSVDKSMIVISLQEVEMGGASVALAAAKETLSAKSQEKGNANAQYWANSVTGVLGRSWQGVSLRQLSGMLIMVYARSNLSKSLGEVKTTSVACGILGVGGNKGAVAVHLSLYRHRMVFVCSHFAAHQHAVDLRNANYHTILQGLDFRTEDEREDDGGEFSPSYRGMDEDGDASATAAMEIPLDLRNVHAIFWMGDLNYRIDGQYDQVCKLAQEGDYATLLLCDQLQRERQGTRVFNGFDEAPVAFQPTYKFDKGTLNTYDTSEKRRVPAWCDRILYYTRAGNDPRNAPNAKKGEHVEVEHVEYGAWMDVIDSDHKPVFGSFTVALDRLDAMRKRKITATILSHAAVDVESVGIPRFVLSPHTITLHPFHNPEGVINLRNKGERAFFFSIQSTHGGAKGKIGHKSWLRERHRSAPDFEIRPVRGIVHAGRSAEIFVKAVGSSAGTRAAMDFTKFIVSVRSEYAIGGLDRTRGALKCAEFNVGLI